MGAFGVLKSLACGAVLSLVLATGATAQGRCADVVPGVKPQNAGRDVVGRDLDEIIERGFIDVAVYEDYPPYSFMEDGAPAGIDIDIGTLIAEALGVAPRFDLVAAAENLEGDLRNHVWKGALIGGKVANVMLRIPYDSTFACRVEQVVFTGQYATESIAIAYSRQAYPDALPVPAYFRFDTVAVENDSIADFYLSQLAGGQLIANISRYPSTQGAMQALAEGQGMAAMGPRGQLEFGLTPALGVHEPPLPGFAVGKWTLGVAVHHAYRALGYAIDDAILAALEDGRIEAIYARYGLSFRPPLR